MGQPILTPASSLAEALFEIICSVPTGTDDRWSHEDLLEMSRQKVRRELRRARMRRLVEDPGHPWIATRIQLAREVLRRGQS